MKDYEEAIKKVIIAQRFEVDELEAQIAYLSSTNPNHALLPELKAELAEAKTALENDLRYAARFNAA